MTSTNTTNKDTVPSTRKPRRMAREPKQAAGMANPVDKAKADKAPSKLDTVAELLVAPAGASIAELVAATGWQQHSVRGAMAGALKKRGLVITSEKVDGVRRYRGEKPA